MLNKIKKFVMEEEGQGLTEYGLLLGGVAVVVAAAVILLKDKITELFNNITTSMPTGK